MQLSAKARLVSIIVAVVFMFGALVGTGAYLIVYHLNNANATTQSADATIGNLFNTDGSLNAENVSKFLTKLQYTSITSSTTLTSSQIASRTGNSGSFVFQMGYYVDPNGTINASKPIIWQATYLRNGYLTIWMANSYTSEYFNNGTSSNSGWKTSSNNYSKTGNYSNSLIREVTKNIYSKLAGKFTTLNAIIKSPSEAGATWQATQQNAYYSSTSYWSITNGMRTNANSGSGKANANPNGWSWDSSVYSDKFWLPSHVEIFNTPDQTGAYNDRGLWGITSANDRKDTSSTALDGKSTSQYCWLRSGSL